MAANGLASETRDQRVWGAATPSLASAGAAGTWQNQQIADLAARPLPDVARALATDLARGLSDAQARARLTLAGRNETAVARGASWPRILIRQFSGRMLLLLIGASVVSLLLREWLNAAMIGVTVVISALFGFINEFRSERAIAALHRLVAQHAEVVRDGLHEPIAAAELVPGDLIALTDGSVVPADARVVEARGLLVNESMLTGEADAVAKDAAVPPDSGAATPATALYAGTVVVAGGGLAVVVATGGHTALGGIAATVERSERRATPLERYLAQLGDRLLVVFVACCALILALGLAQGRELSLVVALAVSLAIGAVPEGLPAVATTTLAVAVRRLAARNVLVRRLDAVETLGSTTVIVTDKTGTLTENQMTLRAVLLPDGHELRVHVAQGEEALRTAFSIADGAPVSLVDRTAAGHLLRTAALCSDALLEHDAEHGWHVHGDPLEGAIVRAATGCGYTHDALAAVYPRTSTEPFTAATRMMRTAHHTPEGGDISALKGAFEQVAALTPEVEPALAAAVHARAEGGYRLIAVAEQSDGRPPRMLGALVLEDPLRADAAEAVHACAEAGIKLVLATGDHLSTARNIAQQAGINADGRHAVLGPHVELDALDGVTVVARATHQQKEALVAALERRGEVVAMTGDGVNDAAALRAADVGVAVGPGATDVAVQAADVVLTDGRLFSLVHGIREGRQITRSLQQAITYLLTASFGVIIVLTLSMALDRPLALTPIQILWLNLVVHIFPALALSISQEPDERRSLPTTSLLPLGTWLEISWRAATVALTGIAALLIGESAGESAEHTRSLVYVTLAVALVGQVFLVGVTTPSAQPARLRRLVLWAAAGLSMALLLLSVYLPGIHNVLSLVPLTGRDWLAVGACALVGWNVNQLGGAAIGLMERRRPTWTGAERRPS